MNKEFTVKFWGVRGSYPTPGAGTVKYGGNTACVEINAGGRIIILDTTRPKKNLLSPFIWFHMHVIIPALGRLISGQGDAYNYLPDTTENFVTAEKLAAHMAAVGFRMVGYERLMFGTIAIHWGEK